MCQVNRRRERERENDANTCWQMTAVSMEYIRSLLSETGCRGIIVSHSGGKVPVPSVFEGYINFEDKLKSTDVGRGDELHEDEEETLANATESESVMTYA